MNINEWRAQRSVVDKNIMPTLNNVLDFIRKANPSDLLQILDAAIDPVSAYIGSASGIETDRHDVLMQIQADESSLCASCNGSGEGMYEGTKCLICKGKGTE